MGGMETLNVQCIDCKHCYTVEYQDGIMWPPEACIECGSVRISVACCAEPKVRGGRCDNCGEWLKDAGV